MLHGLIKLGSKPSTRLQSAELDKSSTPTRDRQTDRHTHTHTHKHTDGFRQREEVETAKLVRAGCVVDCRTHAQARVVVENQELILSQGPSNLAGTGARGLSFLQAGMYFYIQIHLCSVRNWSASTFSWLRHTELYDEPSGPRQA